MSAPLSRSVERREVLAPLPRRVVLLVALGQRPQQRAEPVGGPGAAEQVGELVVPGPRGRGEVALQGAQVDAVLEHDGRVPAGIRTTTCSRARTASVTRALSSMLAPPRRSSRICSILRRTVPV